MTSIVQPLIPDVLSTSVTVARDTPCQEMQGSGQGETFGERSCSNFLPLAWVMSHFRSMQAQHPQLEACQEHELTCVAMYRV
jgi:hypothetical protein